MPHHRLRALEPRGSSGHDIPNGCTNDQLSLEQSSSDCCFYFEPSQDPKCVYVHLGKSGQHMSIIQSNWRTHHWKLVSSSGHLIASFRAGRVFSYIVFNAGPAMCQVMVSINSDMIGGRDDWSLPRSSEVLRWTSNGARMVRVRGSSTELPELAVLYPTESFESKFPQSMMLHWRKTQEDTLPLVVSTAFISMFKWSQVLPVDGTAIPWVSCMLSRICRNLDCEHLAQNVLVAVARRRAVERARDTYSETH